MSVLLYCNDPKEHAKFLETMMRFKKNVCLDLLAVMAYGPTEVLQPSVQLLFHYYPSIDVGKLMMIGFESISISYAVNEQALKTAILGWTNHCFCRGFFVEKKNGKNFAC